MPLSSVNSHGPACVTRCSLPAGLLFRTPWCGSTSRTRAQACAPGWWRRIGPGCQTPALECGHGGSLGGVWIEPWSDSERDFALLQAVNAPELTGHLGGPESDEQLVGRHRRYVKLSADRTGAGRMYRVVLLPAE
ncbi:hypothetical protein GCM10014713_25560 [Streptomyces purpureus]|uniref:Uncharacterized protein n=1 Tax=Streptomyces purpureus TaxID=1951 RepID=A0A918LP87_9ACTN|nr:hypothetical protein GCM10014713_25560 [Streptomyces purpureus]